MLDAYSVDDIVITLSAGVDIWNEPLATSTVEIKGYVEWKTNLVRNLEGEEVSSTVMIRIKKSRLDALAGRALVHEDRVTAINGTTVDRSIIAIHEPKAFSAPHYEVYLA